MRDFLHMHRVRSSTLSFPCLQVEVVPLSTCGSVQRPHSARAVTRPSTNSPLTTRPTPHPNERISARHAHAMPAVNYSTRIRIGSRQSTNTPTLLIRVYPLSSTSQTTRRGLRMWVFVQIPPPARRAGLSFTAQLNQPTHTIARAQTTLGKSDHTLRSRGVSTVRVQG